MTSKVSIAKLKTIASDRRRVLLAMDLASSNERRIGIMQYAREAGWILDNRLMAFLAHGQQKDYLASTQFDGVISLISSINRPLLSVIKSLKVPIVDLWQDAAKWNAPRVLLDHRAAGRMAAQHLVGIGMKTLLFYSHTVDRRVALVRQEGFKAFAAEHGATVHELWWDPRSFRSSGQSRITWLANRLKGMKLPLGVLAVNDVVALEVIDAAEQAGLQIPGQLAVLGIDNDPIACELGAIPLSSINTARERVGYAAAELLDRMMSGARPPRQPIRIAPAGVVPRQSTDAIAVPDVEITKVARFIRENFRKPITVTDILAQGTLSRRRLQDRFRQAIGHGMNQEITRQRIEHSQNLLIQSDQKIATIAVLSGFMSGRKMSKVYRSILATTPLRYRQTYQPKRSSRTSLGNG